MIHGSAHDCTFEVMDSAQQLADSAGLQFRQLALHELHDLTRLSNFRGFRFLGEPQLRLLLAQSFNVGSFQQIPGRACFEQEHS